MFPHYNVSTIRGGVFFWVGRYTLFRDNPKCLEQSLHILGAQKIFAK